MCIENILKQKQISDMINNFGKLVDYGALGIQKE